MAQPSAPRELPRDAGRGLRIGVVVSRFNEALCAGLLESCRRALDELGVRREDVVLAEVPGALEIPPALQWLAQSERCDALVALGAVIRGETYHFELVCNESARGVMDVQLETGLPVANGILTTENEAQALARIEKGAEAARAAVDMARLRAALAERSR
jgi:6,7-dimethyl-8-ribityllumazine synthase